VTSGHKGDSEFVNPVAGSVFGTAQGPAPRTKLLSRDLWCFFSSFFFFGVFCGGSGLVVFLFLVGGGALLGLCVVCVFLSPFFFLLFVVFFSLVSWLVVWWVCPEFLYCGRRNPGFLQVFGKGRSIRF